MNGSGTSRVADRAAFLGSGMRSVFPRSHLEGFLVFSLAHRLSLCIYHTLLNPIVRSVSIKFRYVGIKNNIAETFVLHNPNFMGGIFTILNDESSISKSIYLPSRRQIKIKLKCTYTLQNVTFVI